MLITSLTELTLINNSFVKLQMEKVEENEEYASIEEYYLDCVRYG